MTGGRAFSSVLVANRGEVARRIIRTARRMGLRTVAVHSDADRDALYVVEADEAVRVGPAPARQSYLRFDRIIEAARRTGAEAIHPGYGFLSENADFAEACAEAGLVFVGPPARAIRAMGGKSEAKALMASAGVPLVPGYHGEDQSPGLLATEAETIGFPVLIKASAGGGGKGMRIARDAASFAAELEGAKREAASAFGDERVLIERYLDRPRHVEIQVFADGFGHTVYLFERDCSIQRRHQKVVEEAPAPGLDEATRRAMGEAAVAAAKAIGYVGAGTIEFLYDRDRRFYFMEMNTRLQVEHPVTEMVTGLDLVELQFRVAAGERLPFAQDDLRLDGSAIEVRLYAEDPATGFLPQTGRIERLALPVETPHVRIDGGVRSGDEITIDYDPMIAKLIVWDRDRASAVRQLARALDRVEVLGLRTNLAFLRRIARHPAFAEAAVDTGFIDRYASDLLPEPEPATPTDLAIGALALSALRLEDRSAAAALSAEPDSPWWGLKPALSGWRLNGTARESILLDDRGRRHAVLLEHGRGGRLKVTADDTTFEAEAAPVDGDGRFRAWLDGRSFEGSAAIVKGRIEIAFAGRALAFGLADPIALAAGAEEGEGAMTAPMPGRIVAVHVKPGAEVKRGQPLVVLEAMKMEHTIAAPSDGTIISIGFGPGDQVEEGARLIAFEPAAKPAA